MNIFEFYLDAYWFCKKHNVDPDTIKRKSFKELRLTGSTTS